MNFGSISFTRADNDASYTFDIALSGTADDSKLIQIAPSTQWGSGLLKEQITTTIARGVSYSFGSFGTDPSGDRFAGAGAFASDPAWQLLAEPRTRTITAPCRVSSSSAAAC